MNKKIFHIDRLFHWLTWSLGIFLGLICIANIYLETHAEDLLEKAFYQAKVNETIIDLGNTKNAVGNEILREGQSMDANLFKGCVINGDKILIKAVQKQMQDAGFNGNENTFCTSVLGGTREDQVINDIQSTTQAPLIVRIAKWLLRITIVISISMVIYNGVMYIAESAKGGEVKTTTKNLGLIIGGILVALLSLGIINLISSITVSTIK